MLTLFPNDGDDQEIPAIPGLSYLPQYVTAEDEGELVRLIDAEPWDTTWERRRQLYGATYGPGNALERPIPDWGKVLVDRLYREGHSDWRFNQMLVNEYEPGQGIALHQDHKPFDRTVVSLSLMSPAVMDFRNPTTSERESILLERRSLLVLSDEARYIWQHGIAPKEGPLAGKHHSAPSQTISDITFPQVRAVGRVVFGLQRMGMDSVKSQRLNGSLIISLLRTLSPGCDVEHQAIQQLRQGRHRFVVRLQIGDRIVLNRFRYVARSRLVAERTRISKVPRRLTGHPCCT